MNYNHYNYQCPGQGDLMAYDVPPKVHFPEQPKIYPLDITAESSMRQYHMTDSNPLSYEIDQQ